MWSKSDGGIIIVNNFERESLDSQHKNIDCLNLITEIEEAFKTYKISEVYLNDVADDYGKLKIARLRMDFARHKMLTLLEEAKDKGIKARDCEIINTFLYSDM